jgi:hypothetical protein
MSVSFASSLSAQVKIILHVATGRHPEMDGNSRKNIRDILCRWLHFFQTNIELLILPIALPPSATYA